MISVAIKDLQNTKASKRRAAAKKLRKIGSSDACQFLLTALEKEVENKKAWENQYHMVMAIGQSNCSCALSNILDVLRSFELEPLVRVAFADTITRLTKNTDFLYAAFEQKDLDLVSGALRAMAMEQIRLPLDIVDNLIDYMISFENNLNYFWIAAAAPNCDSPKLKKYLIKWADSESDDVSKAAKAALENKYLKWSIL